MNAGGVATTVLLTKLTASASIVTVLRRSPTELHQPPDSPFSKKMFLSMIAPALPEMLRA